MSITWLAGLGALGVLRVVSDIWCRPDPLLCGETDHSALFGAQALRRKVAFRCCGHTLTFFAEAQWTHIGGGIFQYSRSR
jgi:hypothetical protein